MPIQLSLFDTEEFSLVADDSCDSAAKPATSDFALRIDQRKKALALFQRGYGYRKVAAMLGISVNTVHDWSRGYKKGKFQAVPARRIYSTEEEEKIFALDQEGVAKDEIARRFEMPKRSVRSIVARLCKAAGAQE